MTGGVPFLKHRGLNHKKGLVTGKSGDVEANPLQERLVKDDVDQTEMLGVSVAMGPGTVMDKNVAGFDGKLFLSDDVHPASPRDDDDHREIVGMQRIVGMILQHENIQGEIPVPKDQLPLEFDGLDP